MLAGDVSVMDEEEEEPPLTEEQVSSALLFSSLSFLSIRGRLSEKELGGGLSLTYLLSFVYHHADRVQQGQGSSI